MTLPVSGGVPEPLNDQADELLSDVEEYGHLGADFSKRATAILKALAALKYSDVAALGGVPEQGLRDEMQRILGIACGRIGGHIGESCGCWTGQLEGAPSPNERLNAVKRFIEAALERPRPALSPDEITDHQAAHGAQGEARKPTAAQAVPVGVGAPWSVDRNIACDRWFVAIYGGDPYGTLREVCCVTGESFTEAEAHVVRDALNGVTKVGAALPAPEPPEPTTMSPITDNPKMSPIADMLLKCDACGAVVHESQYSRSESDRCGLAYSPLASPGQFYPCEGRLVPVRAALPPQTGNPPPDYLPPDHDEMMEIPFEERYAVTNFPYTKPSNPNNAIIGPTYYVGHPDGSFTPADPQPSLRAPQSGPLDGIISDVERVFDAKMWRDRNGELTWRGETPDGNEIETEPPRVLLASALSALRTLRGAGSGAETPPQPETP